MTDNGPTRPPRGGWALTPIRKPQLAEEDRLYTQLRAQEAALGRLLKGICEACAELDNLADGLHPPIAYRVRQQVDSLMDAHDKMQAEWAKWNRDGAEGKGGRK